MHGFGSGAWLAASSALSAWLVQSNPFIIHQQSNAVSCRGRRITDMICGHGYGCTMEGQIVTRLVAAVVSFQLPTGVDSFLME